MDQSLSHFLLTNVHLHIVLFLTVYILASYVVSLKDPIVKIILLIFGLPWYSVALFHILTSLNIELVWEHKDFWYYKVGVPVVILIVEIILLELIYFMRVSSFRKKVVAGKKAGNPNLKFGKIDKRLKDIEGVRAILLKSRKQDEKGQRKLDQDLREACKERFPDQTFITALLEQGANVNSKDDEGMTTLHYATDWLNKKYKLILFLLGAGVDPNIQDGSGKTALSHYAFENRYKAGHLYALEVLTKYTEVNMQDNEGKTALFYRAGIKMENTWSFLLIKKWGADMNIKDSSGKMASDYAEEGGNNRLASYLRKKGVTKS